MWAVVALAIAYGIYLIPMYDAFQRQFGEEQWSCAPLVARKPSMRDVGWVSMRTGLRLIVSSRSSISYLGLSCRRFDVRGFCDAIDGGWQRVETVAGNEAIAFDRKSVGVDGSWFRDAVVSGGTAERLIAAFARGGQARVSVTGVDGRVLYVQEVDLRGFNEAMTKCEL